MRGIPGPDGMIEGCGSGEHIAHVGDAAGVLDVYATEFFKIHKGAGQ